MEFAAFITAIGQRMVDCDQNCSGIQKDRSEGILPRCLVLERENTPGQGCVIVGMNPGHSGLKERTFYQQNGMSYDKTVAFWMESVRSRHPYYERLRKLVGKLGFNGPILWTELAKCETASGQTDVPLDTFRNCTRLYLREEIRKVPQEWRYFAVGREAFKALAYILPEKPVIGLPHPTNSRGHFHQLANRQIDTSEIEPYEGGRPRALWLA